MLSYYSKNLRDPYHDVLDRMTSSLRRHGFTMVTAIDLKDSFDQQLHVGFRNYKILSVCDADSAFQAVSMESHLGLMLPCNILVQEHENGEVEVSAINLLQNAGNARSSSHLAKLSRQIGTRLRAVIDDLHGRNAGDHQDALPDGLIGDSMTMPILG